MAQSNGKGRGKREAASLLVRRSEVFERWRAGESQKSLAKAFRVSPATICSDLQIAAKNWREEHRGSVNQHVESELSRLNWAELQAQGEWEKTRDGRFLELLLGCSDRRRKLLGLDAPARSEIKSDVTQQRTFLTRKEMFEAVKDGVERFREQERRRALHNG